MAGDPPLAGGGSLEIEVLDPVLTRMVRENQDKVVGWMRDEPGCWGFLAGRAVAACRAQVDRPLEDAERRLVWDRLWWWLENIKKQVMS
ncbi:MAG TPA: hypothetical protein VFR55_00565 [Dehalococcoidia bacterium]|nr:hypothetical protein [Dehalococcoidia bacterium]